MTATTKKKAKKLRALTVEQSLCLSILELMETRRASYELINDSLRGLQGDFPTLVKYIDGETENKFVDLLDAILGDDLATYYLYEVSGPYGLRERSGGGSYTINGREWIIKTIADVAKFICERPDKVDGKYPS